MKLLQDCSGNWTGFFVQQKFRGWMKIEMQIDSKTLSGKGRDDDGTFVMRGSHSSESGAVEIDKIYPNLYVDYHGRWDGEMISGTWELFDDDSGVFELWPLDDEEEVRKLSELAKSMRLPLTQNS